MAKTKTTFGTIRSQQGESSGDQSPPFTGSPPDMSDASKEIEKKLEEYKQQLMREALEKQKEEIKKKKLEDEKREREEKAKEDEILRLLEEERIRDQEEIEKQLLIQAAENEKSRQKELRDKAKEDKRKAVMRKKEAERKKKEKRAAADSDFEPDSEDVDEDEKSCDEENPPVKKASQKKQVKQGQMTTLEYIAAFTKYEFTGTVYPDLDTTQRLGIQDDYEDLIRGCGLAKYVTMAEPTYPTAAAEFLATVCYCELKSEAFLDSMGGGYITFSVNKKEYTRTLKDLQVHFGFPPGKPNAMEVAKKEQCSIWKLLTGDEKFESGAKGIRIRSPTVAYARKAIAETVFSRTKTGPCSTGDLNVLIGGLKQVFERNPASQELIVGDTAEAGLAFVLVKHLESYRGKLSAQLKKGSEITPIAIGGPITSILKLANVEIDWDSDEVDRIPPRTMDIKYLRDQCLLTGPSNDPQLYYKFQLKDQPDAMIILPNVEATSFEDPTNVQFIPPQNLLVDPAFLDVNPNPPSSEKATASSYGKKKRAVSVAKERVIQTVPCLTQEQQDELKEQLKEELRVEMRTDIVAELTPLLIAQLTPVITAQLTPLITAQLTPVLTAELEPVITANIEEKLARRLKKKWDDHLAALERASLRKPTSDFRLPTSPTGVQQQRKQVPSESSQQRPAITSSPGPPKRPSSGSSSTPAGSGSDGRPKKVPRLHSPPSGDRSTASLQQKRPTIRLNISSKNPSA